MTKRLEDVFNLPEADDLLDEMEIEEEQEEEQEDETYSIDDIQTALTEVDKVNQALAPVRNLEALDQTMDEYASRAMSAFEDLMDLGHNVEDRHAATIFDSASKMMTNALTAQTAKMDKKLKMIQMQLQKQKLDLETKKLEHNIAKDKRSNSDDPEALTGEGEVVVDRNEIIQAVLGQINNNDKE